MIDYVYYRECHERDFKVSGCHRRDHAVPVIDPEVFRIADVARDVAALEKMTAAFDFTETIEAARTALLPRWPLLDEMTKFAHLIDTRAVVSVAEMVNRELRLVHPSFSIIVRDLPRHACERALRAA